MIFCTGFREIWEVHAQLQARRGMAISVASSMCAPVSATLANTEPMTVVRQYVDAFKKSDAAMAANCAEPSRVLDGLAPHVCRGLQLAGVPEHVHLHERRRSCASSRNVI